MRKTRFSQRVSKRARCEMGSLGFSRAGTRGKSTSAPRPSEGDNIGGAHNDRTPGAHPLLLVPVAVSVSVRSVSVLDVSRIPYQRAGAGHAESEIPASDGDGE